MSVISLPISQFSESTHSTVVRIVIIE